MDGNTYIALYASIDVNLGRVLLIFKFQTDPHPNLTTWHTWVLLGCNLWRLSDGATRTARVCKSMQGHYWLLNIWPFYFCILYFVSNPQGDNSQHSARGCLLLYLVIFQLGRKCIRRVGDRLEQKSWSHRYVSVWQHLKLSTCGGSGVNPFSCFCFILVLFQGWHC